MNVSNPMMNFFRKSLRSLLAFSSTSFQPRAASQSYLVRTYLLMVADIYKLIIISGYCGLEKGGQEGLGGGKLGSHTGILWDCSRKYSPIKIQARSQ